MGRACQLISVILILEKNALKGLKDKTIARKLFADALA